MAIETPNSKDSTKTWPHFGLAELPMSPSAEAAMLAAMIQDRRQIPQILRIVPDREMLTDDALRIIWDSVLRLYGDPKMDVDGVTVRADLDQRGNLEKIGGPDFLRQVLETLPSAHSGPYYARIVQDRAVRRSLITAAADVVRAAQDAPSAEQALDTAGNALMRASKGLSRGERIQTAAEALQAGFAEIEAQTEPKIKPTWFELLNLIPGIYPGEMLTIAGRPGHGKTSLVLAMLLQNQVLHRPIRSVFLSFEMRNSDLMLRCLSALTAVPFHLLRSKNLSTDEHAKLVEAANRLYDWGCIVADNVQPTPAAVRNVCRMLHDQQPVDVVVVDYIQRMHVPQAKATRDWEVTMISNAMKNLALELECAAIVLSQLNRACDQREDHRPRLSDLRDCLATDEWVFTPTGPMPLRDHPQAVCAVVDAGPVVSPCTFVYKKTNRVFRVCTAFGDVRATARHRVLTATGYKQVRDLVPGRDVIASPAYLPTQKGEDVPHGRLLGWLLGNGGLTGTPSLVYRTELHDEVQKAMQAFGVRINLRKQQKSPSVYDTYLSEGTQSGCKPNPLMVWIRQLGLEGHTCRDKYVPSLYMKASNATRRALLLGLWETDGSVDGGSARYTTISPLLAQQVAWLLLTQGIHSSVRTEGDGLNVIRVAKSDNQIMAEVLREAPSARFGRLSIPSAKYRDPAPQIFMEWMFELHGRDLPYRVQKRADGSYKCWSKAKVITVMQHCPVSSIEESPYLRMRGLRWTPIEQIVPELGQVSVCDLRVPVGHCFTAGGVVVHNSGTLEQDSDAVIMLYRGDCYERDTNQHDNVAEAIVAKNRHGRTGTAHLLWHPTGMTFYNLGVDDDEQGAVRSMQDQTDRTKASEPTDGLGSPDSGEKELPW